MTVKELIAALQAMDPDALDDLFIGDEAVPAVCLGPVN